MVMLQVLGNQLSLGEFGKRESTRTIKGKGTTTHMLNLGLFRSLDTKIDIYLGLLRSGRLELLIQQR